MRANSRILVILSLLICKQQESAAFYSTNNGKPSSSIGITSVAKTSFYYTTKTTTTKNIVARSNSFSRRNFRLQATTSSSSSISRRLVKFLTCRENQRRPEWLPHWVPTWMCNMKHSTQLVALLVVYFFHITVLCQHSVPFPVQLIPNERGHFQDIGLDSLMGMTSLGVYQYFQHLKKRQRKSTEAMDTETSNNDNRESTGIKDPSARLPSLLSTPSLEESPWKNVFQSKYSRISSFLAFCALVRAYFFTGRFSIFWEDAFYYLANFVPMTVAMHRSLCVLFGHLSWIAIGYFILRIIPRPQNLFRSQWYTQQFKNRQWLWWTMGGYFVSSWFFNIADFCNQWVLPLSILEQAQESVVTQLINPEFNDWLASAVGYIAPCITAPWWEEVLYRGFLLPAFVLNMPYKWAVFWNGVIFSIHHMSPTACIPLAVLGWTWSVLYTKSGNLLTTILVHAMWNSRIFLGSWFGL